MAKNVCTDSRAVKPGDLFFAIKGEKFDGHDFVADVAAKGAVAVVVEQSKIQSLKSKVPPGCGVLVVDDVRVAFGKLAAVYRQDFPLPVIVVGGSNGKTTTKELIATVLRQKLATLWSEASFNNDIGVPATLLRPDHREVEGDEDHQDDQDVAVRRAARLGGGRGGGEIVVPHGGVSFRLTLLAGWHRREPGGGAHGGPWSVPVAFASLAQCSGA